MSDIFSPESSVLAPSGLDVEGVLEGVMCKFSKESRDRIVARAGGASELSGMQVDTMHAMHVDHTKDEEYDNPGRGMLVTPMEHLAYHFLHKGRAHLIGLTEQDNELGLRVMSGSPSNTRLEEYNRAVTKWNQWLRFNKLPKR